MYHQNGTVEEHVNGDVPATEGVVNHSGDTPTQHDMGGEMGVASKVSITVTGDDDSEVIESSAAEARRARMRAQSLPPQLMYSSSLPPSPEHQRDEDGSSLDRSPSHLRHSPGFKTPEPGEISVSS